MGPRAAGRENRLARYAAVVVAAIFVSALWNVADIRTARFHERDGLPKLITSAAVLIYGFVLAFVTCEAAPGRWYRCLILPVSVSAVLCVGFGGLEALDKAGVNLPIYSTLNAAVHAGCGP